MPVSTRKAGSRTISAARVRGLTTLARSEPRSRRLRKVVIPKERRDIELEVEGKSVKLTNLQKPFWPDLGITKGDLIQFYADVSPVLLPHLVNRAMVMKRYPNGAY